MPKSENTGESSTENKAVSPLTFISSTATNMATRYGKIETTLAKAKDLRSYAEKIITKAVNTYEDVVKTTKTVVDAKGAKTEREVVNDGAKKLAARRDIMSKLYDIQEIRAEKESKIDFLTFTQVVEKGKEYNKANPDSVENEIAKGEGSELACIIFTSGTTGEPKGVMLSHSNFIAQLDDASDRICVKPGDKAICVLPVWHAFQRACEYVVLCQGACLAYSKPIGSILLADMQALNPQVMPAVPRVFEAVYDGVMRTMRKTGGIVYSLFRFFTNVALIQSKLGRKLFRKEARFKKDNIVLIDEAYVEFGAESVIPLIHKYGNLLVTRTFSKSCSMAGARLGFGIGCKELIQDLNTIKYSTNPYNVNRMTMAAGVGTIEDYAYVENNCREIAEIRQWATEELSSLGFTATDSSANFIFAKHEKAEGKTLYLKLKEKGVLVRHFDTPKLTSYLRITVGSKRQMQILIATLKNILEEIL